MGGGNLATFRDLLNNSIREVIKNKKGISSKVYLLYSKDEPTYEEEIVDLLADLHSNGYTVIEEVESFTDHGDVGKFFPPFVTKNLKK